MTYSVRQKEVWISAANALLDRGYGRPGQALAITGDKDNPLVMGGAGALTPHQQLILDHIGKKLIYERELKASAVKGSENSENSQHR